MAAWNYMSPLCAAKHVIRDMHHLPGNPLLVLAASLKPLKTKNQVNQK